jgi:hypothetical protein
MGWPGKRPTWTEMLPMLAKENLKMLEKSWLSVTWKPNNMVFLTSRKNVI